jgi:hypothetical protein
MTKSGIGSENCMARRPGASFKVRAHFDCHRLGTKGGAESFGNDPHSISFSFRTGTQAMVNVHRGYVATGGNGQHQ